MRHVVLFTGGMDSFLTLNKLIEDTKIDKIELVYMDLNYKDLDKAEYRNRDSLLSNLRASYNEATQSNFFDSRVKDLGTLDLINYENIAVKNVANVPARNMLIAASTVAYINDDCNIYLTVQKGEMSIPDRSERFFIQTSSLLSFLIGKTVGIAPVFPHMTKVQAAREFLDKRTILPRHVKERLLKETYSCYEDTEQRCGTCGACVRTIVVQSCLGILDPSLFKVSPLPKKIRKKDVFPDHINEYYNFAITYKYDIERCREIVQAVDNLLEYSLQHGHK